MAGVYIHFSRVIDVKLASGGLGDSAILYSAPSVIATGDELTAETVLADLKQAGYTGDPGNPLGCFSVENDTVTVRPGRNSYFRDEPALIRFQEGKVGEIVAIRNGASIPDYALEPQPLVRLEDGGFQQRRPARFADIPKVVVDALLSAEDKHFFYHAGFDVFRLVKAGMVNMRSGRKDQGGSTLTMQLARNLYLDADKTWRRKATEFLIAETLETKLSKQQIFETYVNQVYLGRRHTMALHGFGQAAATYFGKDLSKVSLSEAALLAGLVQRPSFFDPVRHPERAIARRNTVLSMMRQNGFITEQAFENASRDEIHIVAPSAPQGDTPWFLELALEELQARSKLPLRGRIYSTLDNGLQRDAAEAVRLGVQELDHRVGKTKDGVKPEVALVAIDSHTGEVKALVGGRDFSASQVNHASAMRQPGSVFKPFVYAAAIKAGEEGARFTPATTIMDQPRTFHFEGQDYTPTNFHNHSFGLVTLREALAKSVNTAAVAVAEQVGYQKVLDVARSAGFNDGMRATPALALGAYEATPLEVAGAYTVFANEGQFVQPTFVSEVRSAGGEPVYQARPQTHLALDPAVAYVMQDMLTEVLKSGTAAAARKRGLTIPAAGKTGTSRDGWFAGYVSNLICVVWVGYDDNRDLDMEGAKSALPIWTEFMKRASKSSAFHQELGPDPPGVIYETIDPDTGLLAGPNCRNRRRVLFVQGTQPRATCNHAVEGVQDPGADPSMVPASYPDAKVEERKE